MIAATGYPFERLQRLALVIGVAALILSCIELFFSRQQFFVSYLFAWLFWTGISAGGMAIVMMHHLTGGAWGFLIRRPLEAAMQALPLMALLFIPVLVRLPDLYPWAQPALAHDPLLEAKHWYLNTPWFILRTVLYFALWIGLAQWLARLSRQQNAVDTVPLLLRLQRVSAFGLLVYSAVILFASTDWIMSLVPQWYSTTFGLVVGIGQMLIGMSFGTLVAVWLSRTQPLSEISTPGRFNDLGNFLMMFILTWAYLAFTQWLIIWNENLPHEIAWFLPRYNTGWLALGVLIVISHFFLPFFVLLSRRAKRQAKTLGIIATGLLGVHFIYLFWQVAPPFRLHTFPVYWTDITLPIGMGGLWLALVIYRLRTQPLVPAMAPGFREAIKHG